MKGIYLLPPALRRTIAISTFKYLPPPPTHRTPSCKIQTRPPVTDDYQRLDYTYPEVVSLLSTLQSNRAIRATLSDPTKTRNQINDAIPEMLEWFRKAGYVPEDIAKRGVRCIHVAGTSGKGSVCAMVENILIQYRGAELEGSIGTFTSPHLTDIRERIRINGVPVRKHAFIRHFQELWRAFGDDKNMSNSLELRPGYFRFLTILALKIFMEMGVKTAIVECGIGGEYDSTNILPPEAVSVCAITKLELDHVEMLGGTIEEIAWHKGGIIKQDVPVFTTLQSPTALAVIQKRADEKNSNITVVERLPPLNLGDIKLGLLGDFQKDNASLAVSVAASHLQGLDSPESFPTYSELLNGQAALPSKFVTGLETVKLPGRCEIYNHKGVEYCIDGSHTKGGMQVVGTWFSSRIKEASKQGVPKAVILIFNQDERDGVALLYELLTQLNRELNHPSEYSREGGRARDFVSLSRIFTIAAFCPNQAFPDLIGEEKKDLSKQLDLMNAYSRWERNPLTAVYGSVREAIDVAERFACNDDKNAKPKRSKVIVLVTGSLHLVGAWLQNVPTKRRGTGSIKGFSALPKKTRQARGLQSELELPEVQSQQIAN
ncbi:hypothetical protein HYFRA_00005007 [Hymenoscyphus fraxineus]|uniref:Folylpolyglutamate synthase n=1 Tax=Hymenoscyphus fraxineus TaxID=746836 RepID=A0A9N9KNT1_9HELO|nr:hypothetical protein HYFRA_00005007 [Hymenoscyphus fraxineus]